jgi:hypothetical protein
MSAGSNAGVLTVPGIPRSDTTLVAEGSSAILTLGGSGRAMPMVAGCAIRSVPEAPSSRPSWGNRGSFGSFRRRSCTSCGESVPVVRL